MLLSTIALCLAPNVPHTTDRFDAFEAKLEALRTRLEMPGLALGIIRNGELWWSSGLGFADVENGIPVTSDTPFHLASLTKTFASTVLMSLVQEGALELDTPVSEFGLELDSPGVITVRHLFSHTSEGTPGESYSYNGGRFAELDRVLEHRLSMPIGEVLEEFVIAPLQLNSTGPHTRDLPVRLAQGYERSESGEMVRGDYPDYYGVSAGLVSSISDLARYYGAVSRYTLLEPETQALAFTPTKSTLGHDLPYGLGWFSEEYLGQRVLWHYGHWTCISSLVVTVPASGLTFLALANSDHLSRNFQLGEGSGSLLGSPFALAFLRELVYGDTKHAWPDIDWSAASKELRAHFDGCESSELRALLEAELWATVACYRTARNEREVARLVELYGEVTQLEELFQQRERNAVARIERVGTSREEVVEFSSSADAAYRVVAVGEGSASQWFDHGWIQNAAGEVVWRMSAEDSAHAGGSDTNRVCTGRVQLPAGSYRLRYKSDHAHDYQNWTRRPPRGLFWGIALFED
jgi:CubicO group peptidase (beta-lactamase class C family)